MNRLLGFKRLNIPINQCNLLDLIRPSSSAVTNQFSLLTRNIPPSLIMSNRGRGRPSSTASDRLTAVINVKSADIFKDKNALSHHTDEYDIDDKGVNRLVVRRGHSFTARLTMTRSLNFPTDSLSFRLTTGGSPRVNHGSLIYLDRIAPEAGDTNRVGIKYGSISGDTLDVEVFLPADMGVGKWSLIMRTRVGRSRKYYTSVAIENIVVLFNPWAKDDQTYMKNDTWRQEYVLNENGLLYYGSAKRIGDMDWSFDQFDSYVLDAALALMEKGKDRLTFSERQDPVKVSRHMSALVNSNDDDGILIGNWSGEYDDGKSPTDWINSGAIIKQYMDSNLQPVKYGQCWVFSGVLCSILRSLGVPTRSVTNFESAHDTDANLTLDYHYDVKGKPMDNDDSVWNFHVWNDVWMARPDLPEGFGGWQALDATPQEVSNRIFQCGPMSVNAIKQGYIKHDFDGPFIYAEVNATKRYWRKAKSGKEEWSELYSSTAEVGKHISTKSVGSYDREDVTVQYKYPEGTPEEELSFKVARSFVEFTHKKDRVRPEAVVHFDVDIPDSVQIGADIPVKFKFKNVTSKNQKLFVSVVAKVTQYNGSVMKKIFDKDLIANVSGNGTQNIETILTAKDWVGKVKGREAIKFFILGGVDDSDQVIAYDEKITVDLPVLVVKAVKGTKVKLDEKVTLKVSFTNPLSTAISAGRLTINGGGTTTTVSLPKIKAKEAFSTNITVTPIRRGVRRFIAGFSSSALEGIRGEIDLTVE